jgi:hypothetical protein
MAIEFSYEWDSKVTNRLHRVESQSNVTADNDLLLRLIVLDFLICHLNQ